MVGVPVEHLQDRQRTFRLGQLGRHLVGRDERHECVVTVVVLAAERACIGECGRSHELFQIGPAADAFHDQGEKLVGRSLLHQAGQRLERSESQSPGGSLREDGRRQAQILGQARTHTGDEHPAAHIRQELTTSRLTHTSSPRRDASSWTDPVIVTTPAARLELPPLSLTRQRYRSLSRARPRGPPSSAAISRRARSRKGAAGSR